MLKRKFSKKPETVQPEKNVPETEISETENTEAGNEELTEIEPEINDTPEVNTDSEADEIIDSEADYNEVAALQKELTESQDKYLRLAAEFDNYRKRTFREKTELLQTAGESLLKAILPVVDDFERGLEIAANAEDMDAVRDGMSLIYNKLKDFLATNGVKDIQAMDEPFDADLHEAVTKIPAPSEDQKGKIVDVIQKGYVLNSKVIRYPKVIVGE